MMGANTAEIHNRNGWFEVTIGALATKVGSGITPRGGSSRYRPHGKPFVRNQNVGWGQLRLDNIVFIDESTHQEFVATEIQEGDVLLNITGASVGGSAVGSSIGRSAVVDERVAGGNINQHVCIIRLNQNQLNPHLLSQILLSRIGQNQIATFQAGSSRMGLNFSQVKSIRLRIPKSIKEQEAIAEVLRDADALVEELEKLIAKKRLLKQGMIQELLTGKRRLPGFSGKWKKKYLGDFGSFLKGSGIKKDESNNGSLPCIRYGELYTSHDNLIREFLSFINPDVAKSATELETGDILFAGSGETREEIGKCAAFIHEDIDAYAGGDIIIFRPDSVDSTFLGYLFNSEKVQVAKSSKGQGSPIVHISAAALAKIEVDLPEIDEQKAIACIFSEMDEEITAFERKLAKTRQIKQGMMQELLTGRIRLL